MKIFISADIEGVGGVVRGEQSTRGALDYPHAQKLMTAEVNAAIRGAFDAGAKEVVIVDAHHIGLNLVSDEIDERAKLVLGTPRRLGMMEGVDLGFDAAFFIGYHASAGTARGVIAHSYRWRVAEIKLNGRKVGEVGFNAALAGHFGVPVTMISGDEAACAEARALLPHALTVPVKKGLGAYTALCLHPKQCRELIYQSAREAVSASQGCSPLSLGQPTVLELRFTTASAIDRCLRLPGAQLLDGTTLRYEAGDVLEAFQVFNIMADLAELVTHI